MSSPFRMTLIVILLSMLTACGENTTVYTGPSLELGPVEVGLHLNSRGEFVLEGCASIPIADFEPVGGLSWDVGFETTLNQAARTSHYLYLLWQEDGGGVYRNTYALDRPFDITFGDEEWVRRIAHAGDGNVVVFVEIREMRGEVSSSTGNQDAGNEGDCPGAPPQRISTGEHVYVCTARDTVAVRDGPGRGYTALHRLVPGAEVDVIGGPECADDWTWWQVRTESGTVGWMAEGGDDRDAYFLCP